jgi:phosphotransferase system enzyme I (PtsI)
LKIKKAVLKGSPVSCGVGIGEICILKQVDIQINKCKIDDCKIEDEITRLDVAIDKTLFEISDLSNELRMRLEKESNLIFEAYRTILNDKYFIKEIKDLILGLKVYAENAVDICINSYIKAIENSDNEYAKQSIYDIRDLGNRIIRNIIGGKNVKQFLEGLDSRKIISVKCLTPWLAAALGKKNVSGILSEEGAAYLSHSAIILRGLGIPSLNGIIYEEAMCYDNATAIIDGQEGLLIIQPDEYDICKYYKLFKDNRVNIKDSCKKAELTSMTRDGHRVGIMANIGNAAECDIALSGEADGIGLVRTEILFINHKEMPDEDEQYSEYTKIIKKVASKPVIFRTVDADDEKIFSGFTSKMSLNKEGLRGIGYSLSREADFKTQIYSVVRAAQHGNVSLMFPMVNTVDEIKRAKSLVDEAFANIFKRDESVNNCFEIGAVIESKQGIDNVPYILEHVDFISMGTNDLIQQFMDMDRKDFTGERLNYFHPDFLRMLQYCIGLANDRKKPVGVCGEMASDPSAAVLLVGMGVSHLSMHPVEVPKIKKIIGKISYSDTILFLEEALKKSSAEAVRACIEERLAGIINDY